MNIPRLLLALLLCAAGLRAAPAKPAADTAFGSAATAVAREPRSHVSTTAAAAPNQGALTRAPATGSALQNGSCRAARWMTWVAPLVFRAFSTVV